MSMGVELAYRSSETYPLISDNSTITSKKEHRDYFGEDGSTIKYGNPKTTTVVHRILGSSARPERGKTFSSREELLAHELNRRATLTKFERGGYTPKLSHVALTQERSDIDASVHYREGMDKAYKTYQTLVKYFHHSDMEGYSYYQDGKRVEMKNVVSASWDRSTDDLHMARVHLDGDGERICYASRADTLKRARLQAEGIFKTEHGSLTSQGINKREDGSYEMTYVVNSLTNPLKLSPPGALNERESLEKEHKIYEESFDIQVQGGEGEVTVHCRPIHVHHTLSVMNELSKLLDDDYSGRGLIKEINNKGYTKLKELSIGNEEALQILEMCGEPQRTVHERLVLTDLLVKALKLPIVHHCKSVVDRTSVAVSVASVNQALIKEKGIDGVLTMLQDSKGSQKYRELFIGFLNVQHQVSYDARIGTMPDGSHVGREKMGLNLKHGLLTAKEVLGLFPARMKEKIDNKRLVRAVLNCLAFVSRTLFFYYVGLLIGACVQLINRLLHFKIGKLWKDALYIFELSKLPFHLRYDQIKNIDLSTQWKLDADDISGDERNLFVVE